MKIKTQRFVILSSVFLINIVSAMEEQEKTPSYYEHKYWYNVVPENKAPDDWENFQNESMAANIKYQQEMSNMRHNLDEVKKLSDKWLEEHYKRNKDFMNKG